VLNREKSAPRKNLDIRQKTTKDGKTSSFLLSLFLGNKKTASVCNGECTGKVLTHATFFVNGDIHTHTHCDYVDIF